jgi:site-specific DNA recombinase
VGRETIVVEVSTSGLASHLGTKLTPDAPPHLTLVIDARLRRSGKAVRLVERGGKAVGSSESQQHLVRIMYLAQTWWDEMLENDLSASELAQRHGVDKSYVSRVVRLRFLSPVIVQQILEGRQLASLNARRLLGLRELQFDWRAQEGELLAS